MSQPMQQLEEIHSAARSLPEARIPRVLRQRWRESDDAAKAAIEMLSTPVAIAKAYGLVALAEVVIDTYTAETQVANGVLAEVERVRHFGGSDDEHLRGRQAVDQAWRDATAKRDAALTAIRQSLEQTISAGEAADQQLDDARYQRLLDAIRTTSALREREQMAARLAQLNVPAQRKELRFALGVAADELAGRDDEISVDLRATFLALATSLTTAPVLESRALLEAIDEVEPHVDLE